MFCNYICNWVLAAILNSKVKKHYGRAKIVVTLYYFSRVSCLKFNHAIIIKNIDNFFHFWAYSQSRYPTGWFNGKRIAKNYFGFLLHLLFHDYNGSVYDYN
jgi:hypothetical protein